MKLTTIGNEQFNIAIRREDIFIQEKNSDDPFTLIVKFDEMDEFIELLQFVKKHI